MMRYNEYVHNDDRKQLNRAFRQLRKRGYFARRHMPCCGSCAWAEVPEGRGDKAVFLHSQSEENFRNTGAIWLDWSGDGYEIVSVLQDAGMNVDWDGDPARKILVRGLWGNVVYANEMIRREEMQ